MNSTVHIIGNGLCKCYYTYSAEIKHLCINGQGLCKNYTVYVSHATGSVKITQSNYGLCKDYTVHVSLAMDFVKTIQSMYHWLWTL